MIINFTQHTGTPEQGVSEIVPTVTRRKLLTFKFLPTVRELEWRANDCIITLVYRLTGDAYFLYKNEPLKDIKVMIGGAPYFMPVLDRAIRKAGGIPVYAFSIRESVETTDPETGTVTKSMIFRHLGFVGGEYSKVD